MRWQMLCARSPTGRACVLGTRLVSSKDITAQAASCLVGGLLAMCLGTPLWVSLVSHLPSLTLSYCSFLLLFSFQLVAKTLSHLSPPGQIRRKWILPILRFFPSMQNSSKKAVSQKEREHTCFRAVTAFELICYHVEKNTPTSLLPPVKEVWDS